MNDGGYKRFDRERGRPVAVRLEPGRDEFIKFYIALLIGRGPACEATPFRRFADGCFSAIIFPSGLTTI